MHRRCVTCRVVAVRGSEAERSTRRAGATIDDSFLLAVVVGRLEAAVEHVGGTTAAKAGQERGGIR